MIAQQHRRPGCAVQWGAFALGFLAIWPALLSGAWLQSRILLEARSAAAALWYAALPEELTKLAVGILPVLSGAPGILVGLGFGLSETVFLASASPWPIRLLTTVPLHAGTTALALLLFELRRRDGAVLKSGTDTRQHRSPHLTPGEASHPVPPMLRALLITAAAITLLTAAIILHWIYNLAARQGSLLIWPLAWLPMVLWLTLRGLLHGQSQH